MPKVFSNFVAGEGISDKDENGFDVTQNIDATSDLGVAKCQYAFKVSNSVVTEPCYMAQDVSGNIYYFSSTSGNIWKFTLSSGVTALVRTNGYGAHFSAKFFNGDVHYSTRNQVGRYDIATDTWNDSFGTLQNGADYHPMEIVNNILHVGDGKDVASAQINGSYNESALDVETDHQVSALINDNSYLLTGTTVSSNIVTAKAYYWDTYSSSWTIEDEVVSICFFFRSENDLFMVGKSQADKSSIYFWNGNKFEKYRPIRNAEASIHVQATAQKGDKMLFVVGTHIYTLYKPFGGVYGLIREYTADSTIQSIMVSRDVLYISTQTGIYEEDMANRATGVITTSFTGEISSTVEVGYQKMYGCALSLETNINDSGWVSETNFVDDSTNSKYILTGGVSYNGQINFGKVRVTMTPVADLSPLVSYISVE